MLYHYTSEEGMKGILESDRIWATHIRFLNDYTEFLQAFKDEYLAALADSFMAGLPESVDERARNVISGTLSKRNFPQLQKIIESEGHETFVCSFAGPAPGDNATLQFGGDPGDRLSQWRGYSHSSNGFSLGFDRTLLEKQIEFNNSHAKAVLLECKYDEKEIAVAFQDMGRVAADLFTELTVSAAPVLTGFLTAEPNPREEYKKAGSYFLQAFSKTTAKIFTEAARIKHRGFSEECEWRIVLQGRRDALNPAVKFRKGQFGLTPFIEIPLGLKESKTSALQRVVVGPSAHKNEIKQSVELLLHKLGIQVKGTDSNDGVEVATSLIPYRTG
jgi:hypothetical protein